MSRNTFFVTRSSLSNFTIFSKKYHRFDHRPIGPISQELLDLGYMTFYFISILPKDY